MSTIALPLVDPEDSPSDELLAPILHGATRGAAARLILTCGGLEAMSKMDGGELAAHLSAERIPRASANARAILAAFELGRRVVVEQAGTPRRFVSAADVAAWGQPRLGRLLHEELWVLALDARGNLRTSKCVARGGSHGLGLLPTDPLRVAVRAAASGLVLVHNHPSGDPTPSQEDIASTARIAAAAEIVGLRLLDHVVVARGGFASVPFRAGEAP